MKRNKQIYIGAAVLALLLAVFVLARRGTAVETVQALPGELTQKVEDTGYVQAVTDYDLHSTQSARIAQVLVERGQAVKQGQALLVLENLDLAVQMAETRAQLSQAQTAATGARAARERIQFQLQDARDNLSRVQKLLQAGAVTQVEYEKARLQVDTYQQSLQEQGASLDSALAQVSGLHQSLQQLSHKQQQLVVQSPVDGIVLSLPAKQEQAVSLGVLLATVAAADQLEIKADILSDDMAEVKVGQKVLITAPVLGEKVLVGEVKQIYPQAEEKQSALGILQRRVPVIITLHDFANLKPGFEVRVAIETISRQNVLVVPREAVRTTGDGQKEVMVVVNKRVQYQQVTTGISDRENVEITNGLAAGDQIIKDGSLNLAQNTKINI